MATNRFSYSDDFILKDNKVGINSSTPSEKLDVDGSIGATNFEQSGITTFSTYESYLTSDQTIKGNRVVNTSTVNSSISSKISVGIGDTLSVSQGTTIGQGNIQSLKVSNTFTPPIGGTVDRPTAPKPGALFYNKDFKTIEYWDGNFWRQVDNTTSRGRGLAGGGSDPADTSLIESLEMSTEGSAANFGDRTVAANNPSGCSSSIRGLYCGGNTSPAGSDIIDYVSIASAGNATDFGNLTAGRFSSGSCGSSTRGITGGGNPGTNIIDYVEIATLGNSIDFGDLVSAQYGIASASSPTRGFWLGGTNDDATMQYVTIASTGNAIDFGNLTAGNRNGRACSNTTRLLKGGGSGTGGGADVIDYITMASLGNATRFGDLLSPSTAFSASFSNQTRGFWCAGRDPANITLIQKVEIATTGNAESFGDMGTARQKVAGLSDSHGGLGGF